MSKLYLQNIINDISFENLPTKWQGFDFSRFSKDLSACGHAQADKTLFDFQKQGLQNALKGLWLYYSHFQKGWQSEGLTGYSNTPSLRDTPLQEENCEVEFEDGSKINTKNLDYKLIKPLIWWE